MVIDVKVGSTVVTSEMFDHLGGVSNSHALIGKNRLVQKTQKKMTLSP